MRSSAYISTIILSAMIYLMLMAFSGASQSTVVKNYTVGIKYVSFICYPTRDSNGEKRTKA